MIHVPTARAIPLVFGDSPDPVSDLRAFVLHLLEADLAIWRRSKSLGLLDVPPPEMRAAMKAAVESYAGD
uniref:Uncharacterized protein n=1 Tax=Caulobacter phage BL57 TaxID=3348355 RepID=A0AB74UL40_9VIRU